MIHFSSLGSVPTGGVDEVAGPPQRDRLVAEAERRHHLGQVLGEEVLGELCEERLLRAVVRVDGAGASDGRDAASLGLLVDDADELGARQVIAQLALDNARAEALVDEHAARFLAALEVLALALGGPRARLG